MAVHFVKSQKVSTVLSYEHYLLLWIFEKKSTEFSPICLLSNGMSCVQSNLYGEIKPNCLWVTAMVLFFLLHTLLLIMIIKLYTAITIVF